MRLLWFTSLPTIVNKQLRIEKKYAGVTWVATLEQELKKLEKFELAVGFINNNYKDVTRMDVDGISYFNIPSSSTRLGRWYRRAFHRIETREEVKHYLEVIQDFKPDLIHIFGTENAFGEVIGQTGVPVIIQLQGILTAILSKWYAAFTPCELLKYASLSSILNATTYNHVYAIKRKKSMREQSILSSARYILGKTEWDRSVVRVLAPQAQYFQYDNMMREPFYSTRWNPGTESAINLLSVINQETYKGLDMIFNTAAILRSRNIQFSWKIIGISEKDELCRIMIRKSHTRPSDLHLVLMGKQNAETIAGEMANASMFVHPSYIDNSPNSVSEAMLVGTPVVAANIGGIRSLVDDKESAMLVQEGDALDLAAQILFLYEHKEIRIRMGEKAHETAMKRHDRNRVIRNLLEVYNAVIDHHNRHVNNNNV